jgi:6,7-dimethyl-8-ribityllumazine synthase
MHVLIVEARFYDDLLDELEAGATEWLKANGHTWDIVHVPGALEVPGAIAMAEGADAAVAEVMMEEGLEPKKPAYDAYVALGVVIRGETYHFEIVANESARGIMELTMQGAAIGNGILTVENREQAEVRASREKKNKGAGAAEAAIRMAELKQKFLDQRLS